MTLPTVEDRILREKAQTFTTAGDDLIPLMFRVCAEENGIGLAAPQIGISRRLAVVSWENWRIALINPVLDVTDTTTTEDVEGCLSLPGRAFLVRRHDRVKVTTRIGPDWMELHANFWLARVFQHEIDHLNGVLIDEIGKEVPVEPAA